MKWFNRLKSYGFVATTAVLVQVALLFVSGCGGTQQELEPQDLYGIWKLEPREGKKVNTLVVFWPGYFVQITGREGNMSRPARKIKYSMEAGEYHITVKSLLRPLDPPYELERDMVLRRDWPQAAIMTSRGKERYSRIKVDEANRIIGKCKFEDLDPQKLEALPAGE